jgi:hypothetical protein
MIETLKNFLAMVFASAMWLLVIMNIVAIYTLIQAGPEPEEFIFLAVVAGLFIIGVFFTLHSERLKAACNVSFSIW